MRGFKSTACLAAALSVSVVAEFRPSLAAPSGDARQSSGFDKGAQQWHGTGTSGARSHWARHVKAAHPPKSPPIAPRPLKLAPHTQLALRSFSTALHPFPNLPRRLLLDRARSITHVEDARRLGGREDAGTGQGVVIGIVDSGIDVLHPDFSAADGSSRMLWWLDFGKDSYGLYPDLEDAFGCGTGTLRCAILGPDELNRLATGEQVLDASGHRIMPPSDELGHGTHVASLALGSGTSNSLYSGMAPEASLIGVRVATQSTLVEDLDVLLAARFVFERAEELGMPAVLNLSLGGDLGPHDGRTQLEQALGQWVGDDEPGRAVVVAAGNSGAVYASDDAYPDPLGIHTQVHVPEGGSARVPVVVPGSGTLRAAFFVWIGIQPKDTLRVSVEEGDGTPIVPPVEYGEAVSATNGDVDVSVVHHVASDVGVSDTDQGVVVIVSGNLTGSSVFALNLEGEATADLWVQSEGQLSPEAGSRGALLPAATKERTVTVPASSPDVIAVGAVLNRTSWPSFDTSTKLLSFSPMLERSVGSVLFFSSAGPNAAGVVKPDLVAPGGVIIGAMGRDAPATRGNRANRDSIFGLTPLCSAPGCAQVDDQHAVTLGTSMASPLVAGAAALLLESDPSLTQAQLRDALQAGASFVEGADSNAGSGLLNVRDALLALDPASNDCREPSRRTSWLSLGESVARPAAEAPLRALLHLRDADGRPCAVAPDELEVVVDAGRLVRLDRTERSAGLYRVEVSADADTGGSVLAIEVYRTSPGARVLLARRSVPIAVDPNVATGGVSVRGGCALRAGDFGLGWAALMLCFLAFRNRRSRGARARVRTS